MRDVGLDLIGREIGAYRILSLLGAGSMGEVYRARFEREARVLATLNHPRRPMLELVDGVPLCAPVGTR